MSEQMSEKSQKSEYKLYLEISLNLFLLSYLTKNKKNVKRAHCKNNSQKHIFILTRKLSNPPNMAPVEVFSRNVQQNFDFWENF